MDNDGKRGLDGGSVGAIAVILMEPFLYMPLLNQFCLSFNFALDSQVLFITAIITVEYLLCSRHPAKFFTLKSCSPPHCRVGTIINAEDDTEA